MKSSNEAISYRIGWFLGQFLHCSGCTCGRCLSGQPAHCIDVSDTFFNYLFNFAHYHFKPTEMNSILVFITLSDHGIETIKSNPELPKKEMEFVNQWKEEGILESFFISVSRKDAVLLFQNVDEVKAKELIESLPYFPYMAKIEYHNLNKQF